jgi:hypothetical protein
MGSGSLTAKWYNYLMQYQPSFSLSLVAQSALQASEMVVLQK